MRMFLYSTLILICHWSLIPRVTAQQLTGLWRGLIDVSSVNEVHSDSQDTSIPHPTTRGFSLPILIHSGTNATYLLSEVTLMQTKPEQGEVIEKVLITEPELLPNYDGVIRRSEKLTGVRFSAPAFMLPMDAGNKPLTKIAFNESMPLILGGSFTVSLTYESDHPTNPFRHQYHNDLSSGHEITREITLHVDTAEQSADIRYGETQITGTYREKVSGLHALPIVSQGRFSLTKVSNIENLDGQ